MTKSTGRGPKDWSPAEIERLRNLAAAGKTGKQCAEILGRPYTGVMGRASKDGIRFATKFAVWSDAEVDRLRELAATLPDRKSIEAALGRPLATIQEKAAKHGITLPSSGAGFRGHAKNWSADEIEKVRVLAAAGTNRYVIAKTVGRTYGSMFSMAMREGIELPRGNRAWSEDDNAELRRIFADPLDRPDVQEVADRFGVSHVTLRKRMMDLGIRIKRKPMSPEMKKRVIGAANARKAMSYAERREARKAAQAAKGEAKAAAKAQRAEELRAARAVLAAEKQAQRNAAKAAAAAKRRAAAEAAKRVAREATEAVREAARNAKRRARLEVIQAKTTERRARSDRPVADHFEIRVPRVPQRVSTAVLRTRRNPVNPRDVAAQMRAQIDAALAAGQAKKLPDGYANGSYQTSYER